MQQVSYRANPKFMVLSGVVAACLLACAAGWTWFMVGRNARMFVTRAQQLRDQSDWRGAAEMLRRYLRVHTEDAEAHIELASLYDRVAKSPASKGRAAELYAAALVRAPDRLDLCARQAELFLEAGRCAEAIGAAEKLASDKDLRARALEIRARGLTRLAIEEGSLGGALVEPSDAIAALEKAVSESPHATPLFGLLADFYQKQLGQSEAQRQRRADELLDRMVLQNAKSADARLLRFAYRVRHYYEEADTDERNLIEDDLNRALELDPSNPEVVRVAAGHAAVRGQFDLARQRYDRAIELTPDDVRCHVARGNVELLDQKGDRAAAEQAWRRGLESAPNSLDLHLQLAMILVEGGEFQEAQTHIQEVERLARRRGALASVGLALEYYRAQIDVHDNRIAQAVERLNATSRNAVDAHVSASHVRYKSLRLLAECYEGQAQWDLAGATWEELARVANRPVNPMLAAGEAWLRAGQPAAAQRSAKKAAEKAPPEDEDAGARAQLLLARATLELQSSEPSGKRDWSKAESDIQGLVQSGLQRQGVVLAAELELRRGSANRAIEVLEEISDEEADRPDVRRVFYLANACLGRDEAAAEYLQTFPKQEQALLRVQAYEFQGRIDLACEALERAVETATGPEQPPLRYRLAQQLASAGKLNEAREIASGLIRDFPRRASYLDLAGQLAAAEFDWEAVQDVEERLKKIEGESGVLWRDFEARRLLAQTESKDTYGGKFLRAEQLTRDLLNARGDWPRAHLLAGDVALRQGKFDAAINSYRQALRLGEKRTIVWTKLLSLLVRLERWSEAGEVVDALGDRRLATFDLTNASVRALAALDRGDEALDAAQQGAERRPDDARSRILLARTLSGAADQDGDQERLATAERELEKALELQPDLPLAWTSLFDFYTTRRQGKRRQELLKRLESTTEMQSPQREVLLARMAIASGDSRAAARYYEVALEGEGENAALLMEAARTLRDTSLEKAISLSERALALQPDSAQALYQTATLLLQTGDPALRGRALKSLKKLESKGDAPARVFVLLGTAYEQDEDLVSANEAFERAGFLAAKRDVKVLADVANYFLRTDQAVAALGWSAKLLERDRGKFEYLALNVRCLASLGRGDEVRRRVDQFLRRASSSGGNGSQATVLLAKIGQLYGQLKMSEDAEICLRQAAEAHPAGIPYLIQWLLERDGLGEALDVCLASLSTERDDAAPGAEIPVTSLAALLTDHQAELRTQSRFEPALTTVLAAGARHRKNVVVQRMLANLALASERLAEAQACYEACLDLDDRDPVALNNLALLRVNDEDSDEALKLIEKAVEVAGGTASLLSTRAYIYARSGRGAKAIDDLDAADALEPDAQSARRHFSRSIAYQELDDSERASASLAKALALDIEEQLIAGSERELLKRLRQELLRATSLESP